MKTDLIRKPDDWARDWGWVSRRRAVNLARRINEVASAIEDTLNDEGGQMYGRYLRKIANDLAPATVPAERAQAARDKVAAKREP